jgi:hypothetical protein
MSEQYIKNPYTNRRVKVGGVAWHRLQERMQAEGRAPVEDNEPKAQRRRHKKKKNARRPPPSSDEESESAAEEDAPHDAGGGPSLSRGRRSKPRAPKMTSKEAMRELEHRLNNVEEGEGALEVMQSMFADLLD